MKRRTFLAGLGSGLAGVTGTAGAQQVRPNSLPMEQGAYRPTMRAPKADAAPRLTPDERDALEHRLKCQCGCILDVYTCRTTDFTCQVSPAMHRDVLRLIEGGYDADEIMAAFVETYGEVVLTEPTKEGFNWAGYLAPGAAMAAGAVVVGVMIRRWVRESRAAAAGVTAPAAPRAAITESDEDRLRRALREDA